MCGGDSSGYEDFSPSDVWWDGLSFGSDGVGAFHRACSVKIVQKEFLTGKVSKVLYQLQMNCLLYRYTDGVQITFREDGKWKKSRLVLGK
jgi:hypothetical protein